MEWNRNCSVLDSCVQKYIAQAQSQNPGAKLEPLIWKISWESAWVRSCVLWALLQVWSHWQHLGGEIGTGWHFHSQHPLANFTAPSIVHATWHLLGAAECVTQQLATSLGLPASWVLNSQPLHPTRGFHPASPPSGRIKRRAFSRLKRALEVKRPFSRPLVHWFGEKERIKSWDYWQAEGSSESNTSKQTSNPKDLNSHTPHEPNHGSVKPYLQGTDRHRNLQDIHCKGMSCVPG